jgi:O-antigen ligase
LSVASLAAPAPRWLMGAKIADWTITFLIFLGGFVIVEPAPYDLALVAVLIAWSFFGLRLSRHFLPMTVLMLLYVAGGFLSFTQIDVFGKPLVYMLTTAFLAASSIFFAAIIAAEPERRLVLIRNAYVASAVIVALIGILGYFGLLPDAEAFTLYGRAKGTFQDPNVFGPFLVLPLAFLARDILMRRLRRSAWEIAWFMVILFAIFLSFSRAAWGMSVFVILAVAFLAAINERQQLVRFRIVAYLLAGAAAVSIMLAVALSIPAVSDLYVQRAHVVQDYDDSRTGRFERQQKGFFLIHERPLGLGPFVFAKKLGEDEHNMWLKGFTVYGWLGGFSYLILVGWTLAVATPLVFKPRPWQGIVQCTYAAYVGHLLIHNVIDNDHWRHLFLIYGILWGVVAAEKVFVRQRKFANSVT